MDHFKAVVPNTTFSALEHFNKKYGERINLQIRESSSHVMIIFACILIPGTLLFEAKMRFLLTVAFRPKGAVRTLRDLGKTILCCFFIIVADSSKSIIRETEVSEEFCPFTSLEKLYIE